MPTGRADTVGFVVKLCVLFPTCLKEYDAIFKNMTKTSVCDMQTGAIFQCVPLRLSYLNDTVEIFPHGDEKDIINVTFISVCKDKHCKKCISSKKNNYTFFMTAEYGHLMTMSIWKFDDFTFREALK